MTVTHNTLMLWATTTACFFGFFLSGELTTPSKARFNPAIHLAWGDVAVDKRANPSNLSVRSVTSLEPE